MRILLVGIPPIIDPVLRQTLGKHHELIDLDGDGRDLETCKQAADVDVVIHGIPSSDDPLTDLDRAGRATWNLLTTTNARRFIQLSSMRMFDAYDSGWDINETWLARPSTDHRQLAPHLAEMAAREITRARSITALALRLDDVVDAATFEAGPVQPTWLHVDDAVRMISLAVEETGNPPLPRWAAVHVVRGDGNSRFPAGNIARNRFGFEPQHMVSSATATVWPKPAWPKSPQPIEGLEAPQRVVIYGAGGPLAAATAEALADKVQLRLTDRRPLAEVAQSPPQSPGAPLPVAPSAPHEEVLVDVTDPAAVLNAARGMDTIINCTVVRPDPVAAFTVNLLGAWNVMQAAVTLGIKRVVHTGPTLVEAPHPIGTREDRRVTSDVLPRPSDNLYFISKMLGQEVCRVFAEEHGIATIALLFAGFINPEVDPGHGIGPFFISWADSGRAMAAATFKTRFDQPFEVVQVMVDSPHDRNDNTAMKRILGWEASDSLESLLYRREV